MLPNVTGCYVSRLTLPTLAGGGAVTAGRASLNSIGVDKLVSWINASRETVSLRSRGRKSVGPEA